MNKKSTLSKLLKELGNYRLLLLLSIVLSCLTVVLTLYIPILFGATIDYIVDDGLSIGYIVACLKYIALLICVNSFLTWFMNIINNNITFNVVKNIRNKAMDKFNTVVFRCCDYCDYFGFHVSKVLADNFVGYYFDSFKFYCG